MIDWLLFVLACIAGGLVNLEGWLYCFWFTFGNEALGIIMLCVAILAIIITVVLIILLIFLKFL